MNFRKNKGITLVALIITIIILLILAIVTISAVNEGNLFAHANNAATRYTAEAELENTKISDWLTKIEQYDNGKTEEVDNGKISLTITNNNTLVETPRMLSTSCTETLTATLEEGMDPSLLVWSADNENVIITGSGASVTVEGVADGITVITANYNNGQYTKQITITTQNKWRQRGLTSEYAEFDVTYSGAVPGFGSQSMSFNTDGSISAITGGLTAQQVDSLIEAKKQEAESNLYITVTSDTVFIEFPNNHSQDQIYQFVSEGIKATYQATDGILEKQS